MATGLVFPFTTTSPSERNTKFPVSRCRVRTPAEAIEKANNTPYGLSAGIWTEKGSRILAVADKLRAA